MSSSTKFPRTTLEPSLPNSLSVLEISPSMDGRSKRTHSNSGERSAMATETRPGPQPRSSILLNPGKPGRAMTASLTAWAWPESW